MEHQESTEGAAGVMNHPEPAEWMEYLYDELPRGRKREMVCEIGILRKATDGFLVAPGGVGYTSA